MQETTNYRIETGPNEPSGAQWDSMRTSDQHLAALLDYMAGYLDIARGSTHTPLAVQVLEDEGVEYDPETDPELDVHELLEGFALEVRTANWTPQPWDDTLASTRARAVIVLGTGGPHVELDVSYNAAGFPELVTLDRYWSGRSTASTIDTRALDIVAEFGDLFLGEPA